MIGSVDPAYYTGSIAWCPQIVSTNRWIVKLDRILINGKVAFENQLALIDTGTAYIVTSPGNFDKSQKSITGAEPRKNGLMFTFPSESLKTVDFVFAGRSISLQPQDFRLGGIKNEAGRMCSSIVKLPEWQFEDNLWVMGGIFLDNVVTIFDYEARKVGFADISENDLTSATKAGPPDMVGPPPIGLPVTTLAPVTEAPSSVQPSKTIASDADFFESSLDANTSGGREITQRISFSQKPPAQIATGFASLDLGPSHIRAITFATDNTYEAFNLHLNASADTDSHGVLRNPDSDTVLRSGKAAWLRALPNDPNIQIGRWSMGNSYPKGKQLPPEQSATINFRRAFEKPPKVVLWLAGMDFSKAVNWRLKADVTNVAAESFTMTIGSWKDTILYKADVCWIAHADVAGIQSGIFSTEETRGSGWALENKGFSKFGKPFSKPPRLVAALNKIEFGCGRDLRVKTEVKVGNEGVDWSMNSDGNVHQYTTACSYIAFDAVSRILDLCYRVGNVLT